MSFDAFDEVAQSLLIKTEFLSMAYWRPQTIEGDGPVTSSKFSGLPWLGAEGWPRCPGCGEAMQLLLQLNLAELPGALLGNFGSGLIQLFYCTNARTLCEVRHQAWDPFASGVIARRVEPVGNERQPPPPLRRGTFPARRIDSWFLAGTDTPEPEECLLLCYENGIELSPEEAELIDGLFAAEAGDKLGGWPHWLQSMGYPACPACGARMRLLMQLDSHDHLPYQFGDSGCGHLTQCPEHKDQLAFAWANG